MTEHAEFYLDHAASMVPFEQTLKGLYEDMTLYHGNPHSAHKLGGSLDHLLREATGKFASLISCAPGELTWTSSATESNNFAISAAVEHMRKKFSDVKVLYHPMVHSSVREPSLAYSGQEISFCSKTLQLDLEDFTKRLNDAQNMGYGIVLCLPFGSNETGFLDDYTHISELLRDRDDIWVHADAAQSLGKVPINLSGTSITSMTFSGHKIGAPIGVGCLYIKVRPSKSFSPMLRGGGHQENRRSGTVSVPLVRSFVHAAYFNDLEKWQSVTEHKRDFENFLVQSGYFSSLNIKKSLPHILGILICKDHDRILSNMHQNLQFTQSAACASFSLKPSRSLDVLGVTQEQQRWYCRLSFDMFFAKSKLLELKKIFSEKVF